MKTKNKKNFIVGKTTNQPLPDGSRTKSFYHLKEAEAFINDLAQIDFESVNRGDYYIDTPKDWFQ